MVGQRKSPLTTTDDGYLRKIRKPMVEKKRRDRMNKSIDRLKLIIADSITDGGSTAKLDKADVLDFTVSHLQRLKDQQVSVTMARDASAYRSGFKECARETIMYLSSTKVIDPDTLGRLNNHLWNVYSRKTDCLQTEPFSVKHRATSIPLSPVTSLPEFFSTPVRGSGCHALFPACGNSDYMNLSTDSGADSSSYASSESSGDSMVLDNIIQEGTPWRPW